MNQETILLEEVEGEGEEESPLSPLHFGQIPAKLWDEHKEEIARFLTSEIRTADGERKEFVQKLARWQHAYRAPLATEPKDFPIRNASNLTIPLIKESVNTLATQLVQIVLSIEPTWIVKDLAAAWAPFTNGLERFLHIASTRDLKLDKEMVTAIIETVKFGTAITETAHFHDERNIYRYAKDGTEVYKKKVVHHSGPRTFHIPLQNFWIRFAETDLNAAQWCGKYLEYSEFALKQKAAEGRFLNVDDVIKGGGEEGKDPVRKVSEELESTRPLQSNHYGVFEFWLSWDLDRDGVAEELLVYFHEPTQTFLSAQFNPYWHGRRPFTRIPFFPIEHRFYGEGLAEMLEAFQIAISTKHNQRSDNAAMANMKMLVKRKILKTLKPGDPLYTGKIIEANDIWNDIRELSLADIYPSTVQEEGILRSYSERLIGVSEATTGSAMPVTRTTATAQLNLLQEQLRRIYLSVKNIREGVSDIGLLATHLYFQFGTQGKAVAWLGEEGKIVESLFQLPSRAVELGLGISIAPPTSMENKQAKRENSLAIFNLLVQLYEQILPLAQGLAPDELPAVVSAMVRGAQRFMGDVLETFDTSDPDEILAGLKVLERALPAPEDLGGVSAYRRSIENAEILDKLAGLDDLYRYAEESRRGEPRVHHSRGEARRVAPEEGVSGGRSIVPVFGGRDYFGG